MILLPYESLRSKGITLSKCQIWRLEKVGRFPRRVRPSAGRVAWIEAEVDQYLRDRVSMRPASPAFANLAAA